MKGLEALGNIFNVIYSKPTTYDEDLSLNVDREIIEKELKAFDIIKENFDIEAIVIDDYCYIEITSKICKMSKTQRAIKITPENKNKVEALGFVEGLKYLKQKLKH
jgi:hypothetical protein